MGTSNLEWLLDEAIVVERSPDRRAVDTAPREPSPAPCWWCSRKLRGGYGVSIAVDGNVVYVHRECGQVLVDDDDLAGRIVVPT